MSRISCIFWFRENSLFCYFPPSSVWIREKVMLHALHGEIHWAWCYLYFSSWCTSSHHLKQNSGKRKQNGIGGWGLGGGIFPLAWLTLIHALGVLLLVYLYFSGSCFSLSLIPISVCPPGKSQLFSHGLHPWHSRAGCVSHLGHTNPDLDWRWRGWIQRVRGFLFFALFFFFCFFCLCASPSERWVHPEKHPVTFLPLIPEGQHWVWAWTRVIGSGLIE